MLKYKQLQNEFNGRDMRDIDCGTMVSVIIPTYNRCHTITDAIDSVLKQTYSNYEIIVIDDGSVDNTRQMVSAYGDKVKYLYQQNRGPSAARNTGIQHAQGELIAFLDSDDVWREDKLALQVACFIGNRRLGIVASGHEIRNNKSELLQVTLLTAKELRQIRNKDFYRNFFSTPSVMVKAECFKGVGNFDEGIKFAEDWDMWLRIMYRYEFEYIKEPLTTIRVHGPGITRDFAEMNMDEWSKVLVKHRYDLTLRNAGKVCKRYSWYFLNKYYVYKDKNHRLAKICLLKSICLWPFWYPYRYYGLIK